MKMKNNLKSLVFYQSHDMVKNSRLDFSAALKIAWQIYRMKKDEYAIFNFKYKKLDGSIRFAQGMFDKNIASKDVKAQHYYDIEKHDFRAFKPALFIEVYNSNDNNN